MIIRKPYAFLIKNFKKIHIFLLLLCCYIYYKNMQTRSFVSEFLQLGTYDAYNEPITDCISGLAIISLLIVIGLSLALVIVLRHKKKPWKLYIIPVLSYAFMLVVFLFTVAYFNGYEDGSGTTVIRAISDLLFMSAIPQYFVIIIFLIRIFGIDLNKFDFKSDQEYLELSNEDKEEVEISINIDRESFRRTYRRLLRNIGYVYEEHKLIVHVLVVILLVISLASIYNYVFIVHKSYREGDVIDTNGYTIDIHHSYFTNKDYHGAIISKESNFVILDLTIQNNVSEREVNFNRFHIMNGTHNYSPTYRTYAVDFQDLGSVYDKLTLKNGEKKRILLIYKVDKKLDANRFVLYYQEVENNQPYLRKIKLEMEDLSKIEKQKLKALGDIQAISVGDESYLFTIEEYSISNQITYNFVTCSNNYVCSSKANVLQANEGKLLMQIFFTSDTFTGKDFVDFSMEYGKIVYIDNKGKSHNLSIVDAVNRNYDGNYMYIEVPSELQEASKIRLIYTIRNKEYTYELK